MNSCNLWILLAAAFPLLTLADSTEVNADEPQQALTLFIGTYTGSRGKGIYSSTLDKKTGRLSPAKLVAELKSPSFLAIHPNGRFLYAVSEVGDALGKPAGAVAAFAINPQTHELTPLNQQTSSGKGPCHLTVDTLGKTVLVANYSDGSLSSIAILPDGKLGDVVTAIQHTGTSVDPQRQTGPHAHSINLDPANRFAFCADLGLDKIMVYSFDAKTGKLSANDPPAASVTPGAGPRHFTFLPNGRFAYVINEIGNTVTAFQYDEGRGVLTQIAELSTLPADYKQTTYTAEIVAHPSGRFLYGSNRGHDSIAVFAVDSATGKLKPLGQQPTGGKTPRNFAIDPTGTFLLAENQDSDSIVVFRIDPETGLLKETGYRLDVPAPVCVRFLPAP